MIRIAALAFMAAPAAAQTPCLPRADMAEGLRDKYDESLTARFLTQDETALIEVYTAPESWTIIVTNQAGMSCMTAAGGAWTVQGVPQGEEG